MSQMYKVKEVAEILNLSIPQIYKEIDLKRFPCVRFGKAIRIPKNFIDELIGEVEETKPVDFYLTKELFRRNLKRDDVELQETAEQFLVFTNGKTELLFTVAKYVAS